MLKSIEWQEALCSSFQQNEPPALLRGWSWSKTSFPPALSIFQRPPANKCHAGGSVPNPGPQVINRKPAAFAWHEETQQPCCWSCGGSTLDTESIWRIWKVRGEPDCWGVVSAAGEQVAGECWDSVEVQLLGHCTDSAYVCYWVR